MQLWADWKKTFACFSIALLALGAGVSHAGYNVGMFWKNMPAGSVKSVYPSNGANWNDYVKNNNSGTTVYNQPDTACTYTSVGYYGCIHGGEKRRVDVIGKTSCAGITASDFLGAFDWICDASTNPVRVYSVGLKQGKGLRDLISGTSFKTNYVTIYSGGFVYEQTKAATWWTNTIQTLPTNALSSNPAISLTTAGTGGIYVASSSTTSSGYHVPYDKTGIVTLAGVTLTYSGNASGYCDETTGNFVGGTGTNDFICNHSSYTWLEVSLNGTASTHANKGLFYQNSSTQIFWNRVHLSTIQGMTSDGFNRGGNNINDLIDQSIFSNNGGAGIYLPATSMAVGLTAINNAGNGISLGNLSSCVVANALLANNGGNNLAMVSYSSAPSGNVLSQITALNATSDSITLDKAAGVGVSYNTLAHITSMQQHQGTSPFNTAMYLNTTDHNTFSDLVLLNTETALTSSEANGKFYDLTVWGNDTVATVSGNSNTFGGKFRQWNQTSALCNVTGTGNNLNNTCQGAGITAVTGFDLSGSYVGYVTDSVNASNANGLNAYASITDWTNFENPYRTWGPSGTGGFLDKSRVDRCASGTCQIYDTRLNVSDTVLRNANGVFTNGAACPASINASIAANVITDTSGRTFLKNAVEIIGDGIGNENGLCESGEACIYAPNAGAYQGEGNYATQTCTYTGGNGVTNVTMYGFPTDGSGTVDPVYPLNGFNWNDYVKWTNKGGSNTVFNQPDAACAGTEPNYLAGCIHGGEKRKYIVTGQNSCTGLAASDALGVFDWICDASSGTAIFYSKGLKSGMGLKNLLNSTTWKPNSLTVTKSAVNLVQSELAVWWGNPVIPLPVNRTSSDAPVSLSVVGGIYTLNASDATSGYLTAANKIAIVTLGGSVLNYSGYATTHCQSQRTIFCGDGYNFIWVEGNFDGSFASGTAPDINILMNNAKYARLHQVNSYKVLFTGNGIWLGNGFNNSLIDSTAVYRTNSDNYLISSSNNDIIMNSTAFDSLNGSGFSFPGYTNSTVLYNNRASDSGTYNGFDFNRGFGGSNSNNFLVGAIATANKQKGVKIDGANSNLTAIAITTANNLTDGVGIFQNSPNHTFSNVVALNNALSGISASSGVGNRFTDIMAGYSASTGVYVVSNNNQFNGKLWVGNNGANCVVTGTGNTLDNACNHGAGLATPAITGINASASFLGIQTSNDTVNGSTQTNGTTPYAPLDWNGFQNIFRTWGKSGASTLAAAVEGDCNSGTCQIFDWSSALADTLIKNSYGVFANGAACPASVDASVAANVLTDQQTTVHTYLRSAIEVMDPVLNPNGNFNGICESNEACIYTPNLGGYQGDGDFSTQSCTFTGGNGVTGVTMYAYPVNGTDGSPVSFSNPNLQVYSQEFENWIIPNPLRGSINPDVAVAPDGTSTADFRVEGSAANTYMDMIQNFSNYVPGSTVTVSIFAKASTRNQIYFELNDGNINGFGIGCDLGAQTTSANSFGTGSLSAKGIISVGNGWYRCWMTGVITTVAGSTSINNTLFLSKAGSTYYSGDGVSGLYLWGMQVENGSILHAYQKN